MQEVPEGRSKVGQRILLLVAEEVGGSGSEPGSQGARESGSQRAREPGSQGARESDRHPLCKGPERLPKRTAILI